MSKKTEIDTDRIINAINILASNITELKSILRDMHFAEAAESFIDAVNNASNIIRDGKSINGLSQVKIGENLYERIDKEYDKGTYNVELKSWAMSVVPDTDQDLFVIKTTGNMHYAKGALENIIAKLNNTEKK